MISPGEWKKFCEPWKADNHLCEVSIRNREIAAVYKAEIVSYLLQIGAVTRTTADQIAESLYTNDVKKLQSAIAEYMDKSISFYDAGAEGFYLL